MKLFRLQTAIEARDLLDEIMWVKIFLLATTFETAMKDFPVACNLCSVSDLLWHLLFPLVARRRRRRDWRRGRFGQNRFVSFDAGLDHQAKRAGETQGMISSLLQRPVKGLERLPVGVIELDVDGTHAQRPNVEELLFLASSERSTYSITMSSRFQRPCLAIANGDAPFCAAVVA